MLAQVPLVWKHLKEKFQDDRCDEGYELRSRFGLSVRGFVGMDDCSIIGFDISVRLTDLFTVSGTGFLLDGFFKTTGYVFHESGVIKPEKLL